MNQDFLSFGEELRRRRLAAGLSLSRLAEIVHYSKAQLSKVERGINAPSPELVRLCDAALRADGSLASLARPWPASRRQILATGALVLPAVCLSRPPTAVEVDHTGIESVFSSLFEHYRNLGQDCAPSSLLPALIAQTNAIQEFAKITSSHTSRRLLSLSSRYAEYTGWLAQETGNDLAALRWTRRAVDLAEAAGDVNFAAYGFVRHGLVTMYRGEATQTTQLAGRAQASSLPPRIRGLAAAREAQGHAIAADYDSAMRALDRARTLLSTDGGSEQSVIGSRNLADQAEMTRGWCLYDLGRPGDAAAVIGQQMAGIPPHATRSRVRYGARWALAHAAAGDIDHACALAADLLDGAGKVRSATVAKDLIALARVLGRHPGNRAVHELSPRLGTALHGTSRH
jgi:transcriptional regulator with XRE-family HTH domain